MVEYKFGDVLERGVYNAPYHKTMRVMVIERLTEADHYRCIFIRNEGPYARTGEITVVSGWVKANEA